MNKQLLQLVEKINELTIRERLMILITIVVLLGFSWWILLASPLLTQTKLLNKQNSALVVDMQNLDATVAAIQKRIKEGVHTSKQQKLELLNQELQKVNNLLREKTLELIEPEEMFELMQQLIFAESKLKLTGIKRKQVKAAFSSNQQNVDAQQPEIYRHVLQMSFEGSYKNVLDYIKKLEELEWKLIWDRISLKTSEYPVISVDIEISTLSDNKNWVGL